jgi:hypothetical protein
MAPTSEFRKFLVYEGEKFYVEVVCSGVAMRRQACVIPPGLSSIRCNDTNSSILTVLSHKSQGGPPRRPRGSGLATPGGGWGGVKGSCRLNPLISDLQKTVGTAILLPARSFDS